LALPAVAAPPLPALDAEKSVTVSGVSSGAYMAVQLHVAHSARVAGAGAIAGGPYYCAQGSVWTANHNCMSPGRFAPLPDNRTLRAAADGFATQGRIDPISNLAGARAWLFSGGNDQTVSRAVVEGLLAFYQEYKTEAVLVRHEQAGHAMITEAAGNACATTRPPFINDCDYDAAGALLQHLLGRLAPPRPVPDARLRTFDQGEFAGTGMDGEGYAYIPSECERRRCRVHVAFHGCRQGKAVLGDRFAREAGYNRWAESNRLIVLYPQAVASRFPTYNPRGCWDWWGYTGREYATREGAQIRAVSAMLERLSAPRQ
jgi:poly(3-hydroxybutyrate) depolymerase